MRLTRKFHFRYLGFWIVITVCLLVLLNVSLYLLLEEQWKDMRALAGDLVDTNESIPLPFLIGVLVETALFAGAAVFLAMSTAHRIAGPYIRLQRTFREVSEGNLDLTLKFREYDRLEELEEAFNAMMATFRQKLKEGGTGTNEERAP
jgi:nitrogen fixation/metabolism regulation signal transduction histidine kinase